MPPNTPPNLSNEVQALLNSAGFKPEPSGPPEPQTPVPLIEDLSIHAWVKPPWFDVAKYMILQASQDTVFVGSAATGKSTGVVHLVDHIGGVLHRISASRNMDESNFLGKDHLRTESSGLESYFKDGVFVQAARAAAAEYEASVIEKRPARIHVFNIEEANTLDAGTMMFLNSWTDGWGAVLLETGEVLHRPPNFRIMITMNDGYTGTRTQNEALYRSRFFIIECPRLTADMEKKVLAKRFPSLTPKQVEAFVLAANTVRGPRDKGEHDYDVSLRCIFQAVKLFDFLTFHQNKPPSGQAIIDACRITFMPKIGNAQTFGSVRKSLETGVSTTLSRLFPDIK